MKNQELDRLFRQKFDEFREKPSLQAWQQLEDQLQQKKGHKFRGYFSGIAASLLMLFGLWAAMEYSQTIPPAERIAQKTQPEEGTKPKQTNKEVAQELPPLEKKEASPLSTIKEENTVTAKRISKEVKNSVVSIEKQSSASVLAGTIEKVPARKEPQKPIAIQASELAVTESITSKKSQSAEENSSSPSEAIATKESIIIRYNATDAPEKAMAQKAEVGKSEDKEYKGKELSARKVIGFLKKVKSSGSGNLAELREAKDELLSFRLGKAD